MQAIEQQNLLSDPTRIHPSIALTIASTVDSYGIDSDAMLAELGIDKTRDLRYNMRVVGSLNDEIWRAALRVTNDDAIGIKFVKHFQIGSLSGLGFCWAASNTLLDGFLRLSRYFSVISTAVKIEVIEHRDVIRIILKLPVPYGVAADPGIDACLALFVHLSRLVLGDKLNASSLQLQRPKPLAFKTFDAYFKCPIHYDADTNELSFDKAVMLEPLQQSNPDLARINDQVVVDYIRQQDRDNYTARVASIIAEDLPLGTPSQTMVAKRLNIGSKTLQRRLTQEGTSFSALLNQIRQDLSIKYLKNEWRSISEISYLLGFTEPSNFTRWFKEESGESPTHFRDVHQED